MVVAGFLSAAAIAARYGVQATTEDGFVARAHAALATGQLDEAEKLASEQPADAPAAAAVRGRVLALRGRYADAVTLLAPVARAHPASDAALELGLVQITLGRRSEAERVLEPIVDEGSSYRQAADLFRAARAAHALGLFREANTLFRRASGTAPDDPAINTAWGDLFVEKYNRPDALKSYQAALRANESFALAHLGLARAVMEENPPAAKAAAERALTINPSLVPAHLLLAELALDDRRREEARASIARALERNAASLEAHALLGAVAYLEGRTAEFEAEVGRVLAINPKYGEAYRVAGDHAARNYRFDEAVVLVRRALEVDPTNTRAHADLGIHLLRTGDEPAAREALNRAFKADPYDVVTYNLLGLFDSLETFETIQEGDVILRMHPEEAPVLREYAMPLAQEALRALSARYGFTPRGPILVEIFPKHDDFAVRNVGLPGMIGALGACFGRVVTMDSPRARPPGSFSWSATLWHELAHVITLQMSNQRVPRWLTEGLSVYEEQRARPEWGREMEVRFAQALNRDEVLKVRDLNDGFSKPETIALAYYEASLLVDLLVALHGEPAIHQLLRAYGEGLEGEAALKAAVGVGFDQLQEAFDRALESKFGALRRALAPPEMPDGAGVEALKQAIAGQPASYALQLALGEALASAGQTDAALAAFERAAKLVPTASGKESARAQLIDLAIKKGDRDRALRELEMLLGYDHTDIEAARRLAELAEGAGDEKRMWLAYERIVALDPFDAAPHGALGRLALARGDLAVATREFRAAVAAGPVDRAGALCDLADSYAKAGKLAEAKQHALAALEVAPTYERAQDLLLRILEGKP